MKYWKLKTKNIKTFVIIIERLRFIHFLKTDSLRCLNILFYLSFKTVLFEFQKFYKINTCDNFHYNGLPQQLSVVINFQ